ncbi:MAG: hypothetical protein V4819_04850 [Verrucomicrobiota bacterium]
MHRFPSKSTISRFKFVAFLLCFRCVAVPAVVGMLVYSFIEGDQDLTIIALGLGLACVLMSIIQWLLAARTRCPLCLTPVLASNGCSKHRHARTLFGSYRLRAAIAILFRNSFLCPYCHEPSVMEVRSRQPRTQSNRY